MPPGAGILRNLGAGIEADAVQEYPEMVLEHAEGVQEYDGQGIHLVVFLHHFCVFLQRLCVFLHHLCIFLHLGGVKSLHPGVLF